MVKKQRETLAKLYDYSEKIGNHKPNFNTKFWKYRDAVKVFSKILIANFGAWDNKNDYQEEDQLDISEGFKELDEIIVNLEDE
jgi:hypothetical protein